MDFNLEEVLDGLGRGNHPCCAPEKVDQAKANVEEMRDYLVSIELDTKEGGCTRKVNPDELEYCLMISTYTDTVLFGGVSHLLNDISEREKLERKEEVEAAQLWISCIRWSLENLARTFPGWVHRGKKWRGMKFRYPDLDTRFEKGAEIAWYTIKSVTCSRGAMAMPCFAGQEGPRTIFEIRDCAALDISQISWCPDEQECLLWPGSYFAVEDVVRRPKKMCNGDPFQTADKVVLKFQGHHVQGFKDTHPAVMVIGNPGSGKSTYLNRYAERRLFGAGFSAGTGFTDKLQTAEFTDARGRKGLLIDTPGLDDISKEKKEAAAAAIFNGLMMVEDVYVFFIVTLEEGRIRPADVETILTVLYSCEDLGDKFKYGLIVNKCPGQLVSSRKESRKDREVITRTFQDLFKVQNLYIHFAPHDDLTQNPCAPLGKATLKFMDQVPMTCRQQEIKTVNIEKFKVAWKEVIKLQDEKEQEICQRMRWQRRANCRRWLLVLLGVAACGLLILVVYLWGAVQQAEGQLGEIKVTQEQEAKAHRDQQQKMQVQMQAKDLVMQRAQQEMKDQQQKQRESEQAKADAEEAHRASEKKLKSELNELKQLADEARHLRSEAEEKVKAKEKQMENELHQMEQMLWEGTQAKENAENAYRTMQNELSQLKVNLEVRLAVEAQQKQAQAKAEYEAQLAKIDSQHLQAKTEVQNLQILVEAQANAVRQAEFAAYPGQSVAYAHTAQYPPQQIAAYSGQPVACAHSAQYPPQQIVHPYR